MAKFYIIALVFIVLVLAGCTTLSEQTSSDIIDTEAMHKTDSTKQQRSSLVGCWYRKQPTKDGRISEELTVMNVDGTYIFQVRLSNEGEVLDTYVESGLWGISGGYHFTFALAEGLSVDKMWRVNSEDHKKYWAYKVIELSPAKFRYQTVATGNIFELHRVAEDFRLD